MFTGIIKEIGIITNIKKSGKNSIFTIRTKSILNNKKVGQSIAVNGACSTITKIAKNTFEFTAMPETLKRTNLKTLKKSSEVNLEDSLKLNEDIDGHLIQGHVDTEGEVTGLTKLKGRVILTIKYPKEIAKYLAFKGSISINGVSLTISDLTGEDFSVDLIPHTLKNTNLSSLKKKDKVNLEIDMIARYLKRLLDAKEKEFTYDFLKERGFI